MRLCVVVTALNDQSTLLESIESLLSQRELPGRMGLVLGPSRDDTDEFAGFYHDEFDFVTSSLQMDADRRGRSELRLASLDEVDSDYVLFLPGHCYLYRDAVERIHAVLEGRPDYVVQPISHYRDESESPVTPRPDPPFGEAMLRTAPHPAAGFVWRVEDLVQNRSRLGRLRAGPFSNLAWYLRLYATGPDPSPVLLEDPAGETPDYREGTVCWSRSVFRSLAYLRHRFGEEVPGLVEWVRRRVERGQTGLHRGLARRLRAFFELPESEGPPPGGEPLPAFPE